MPDAPVANGQPPRSLEDVAAERDRLIRELDEARRELTLLRCRAEVLRDEWLLARLAEKAARAYLRKTTGHDPFPAAEDILDAELRGGTLDQILAEVDKHAAAGANGASHG